MVVVVVVVVVVEDMYSLPPMQFSFVFVEGQQQNYELCQWKVNQKVVGPHRIKSSSILKYYWM